MKNFWLRRRRKREMHERINQINAITEGVINQKMARLKGGAYPWRKKKDTKTRP